MSSSARIVLRELSRSRKLDCSYSIINALYTDSLALLLLPIDSFSSYVKCIFFSYSRHQTQSVSVYQLQLVSIIHLQDLLGESFHQF